jgi:Tfp pilus assembly protein PilE
MKRVIKSILGVTLLEIMLVLAIASMVIVMSMKYYQSASNSQKVGSALSGVTAVVAAGESVLAAKGSFTTAAADIPTYLPNGAMPFSPWGGVMQMGAVTDNTFIFTIPNVPAISCTQLTDLAANNKKTVVTCSGTTATVTVTE